MVKKGCLILLVFVILVIMLFVLVGLLIRNVVDMVISNVKKSVGVIVILFVNWEVVFKKMCSVMLMSKSSWFKLMILFVKLSDVKKIVKFSNVLSYNVIVLIFVNVKGFDMILILGSSIGGGMKGMGGLSSSGIGDILIIGVINMNSVLIFESSLSKIMKGCGIIVSDEGINNVVIESELVKEDSLSVGDMIKLKVMIGDKKIYMMKIVGIYKVLFSVSM